MVVMNGLTRVAGWNVDARKRRVRPPSSVTVTSNDTYLPVCFRSSTRWGSRMPRLAAGSAGQVIDVVATLAPASSRTDDRRMSSVTLSTVPSRAAKKGSRGGVRLEVGLGVGQPGRRGVAHVPGGRERRGRPACRPQTTGIYILNPLGPMAGAAARRRRRGSDMSTARHTADAAGARRRLRLRGATSTRGGCTMPTRRARSEQTIRPRQCPTLPPPAARPPCRPPPDRTVGRPQLQGLGSYGIKDGQEARLEGGAKHGGGGGWRGGSRASTAGAKPKNRRYATPRPQHSSIPFARWPRPR